MEIREVDRDTDLVVFGEDGQLQTREGRYFGADKTGRRGFTYRLHFVMQVQSIDTSLHVPYVEGLCMYVAIICHDERASMFLESFS